MFPSLLVCLSVCLLATLCKNFQIDLHEIFREVWQWASEQTIKFGWRSGSPSGYGDCFPVSLLLGNYRKWLMDINLLLHPVIYYGRFME